MAGLRSALEKRAAGGTQYFGPLIPARPQYREVSGVVVTPDTAVQVSTVFACVKLISDTISSLPVSAFVRRGRARISYAAIYGQSPAWLQRPNPENNLLELLEQIIASLKLHGNAYVLTVRDAYGDVVELYVLNPNTVTITRPRLGGPLIYRVHQGQGIEDVFYTSLEVLHIPEFRLPGQLYGLSPIGACRQTVGSVLAADTFAAAYFGNSANPGGVIEAPGTMDKQQIKDMGDGWNLDHAGPYQSGKVGILSGGAQFKTLGINAQDAQLLEARRFNVEDIARLFRVPISLLGHPVAGAMSFASVEAQNLSFVQHSLRPLLERLERALSSLLPESDGFIKFNLDALLRGTTTERYENYAKGTQAGFLSINDIHASEDQPPIGPEGDQYRVPLGSIDAADAEKVGLDLQSSIIAKLIDVGFEPEDVLAVVGVDPIKHTGLPPIKLQQLQRIDPLNPDSVYVVDKNPAK